MFVNFACECCSARDAAKGATHVGGRFVEGRDPAACPLQKGVAAAITQAFYRRGWDTCGYDQYVDHEKRHFFARVEWEIDRVPMNAGDLQAAFREEVADVFGMHWSFWPGGRPMRLAIFVTTETDRAVSLQAHQYPSLNVAGVSRGATVSAGA